MKLLSIIIPVYNVADYLNRCLQTVVKQTYRNLEILLIDDGSTDGSAKICDQWALRDKRIKVLHSENHGVSHARNLGLNVAKGEYIGFLDADDWIDYNMYESLIRYLESQNTDICVGGFIKEQEDKSYIPLQKQNACTYSREDAVCEIFTSPDSSQLKFMSWELWDKLFKADLFNNIRFTESIYVGEDMLLLWQVLKHVKRVGYLPLFGYHYYIRPGSAVNSAMDKKHLTGLAARQLMVDSAFNESEKIQKVIEAQYIGTGIYYVKVMLESNPLFYKEEIIKFQQYLRKNIFSNRFWKQMKIKQKILIFYLMLPYPLAKRLIRIAKLYRYIKNH